MDLCNNCDFYDCEHSVVIGLLIGGRGRLLLFDVLLFIYVLCQIAAQVEMYRSINMIGKITKTY